MPGTPRTPRRARTPASNPTTPTRTTRARGDVVVPETPTQPTGDNLQGSPASSLRSGLRSRSGNVTPQHLPMTSPARTSPPGISEVSSPLNYGTPSSLSTPRSTLRGTPARSRPDLPGVRTAPNVPAPSQSITGAEDAARPGPQLVVWGTDVAIGECQEKFRRFLMRFSPDAENNDPFYIQKLEEIHTLEEPFLDVDCNHVQVFDERLHRQLICYPQEVVPAFDAAANELFFEKYPAAILEHQIQVRPFNAPARHMRDINPEDIDQLVTLTGMVIRASDIIPELREAYFQCSVCNHPVSVEVERGRVSEPTTCGNCHTRHCYRLIHNRCHFTDKQLIKLQESPEEMPAGRTPATVSLVAHGALVGGAAAGERVSCCGVLRAPPAPLHPRTQLLRAAHRTHLDVLHFRRVDAKTLHDTDEGKETRLSAERVAEIRAAALKGDTYERLARAVAPSVYGNLDVKKGVLLQLLGGTNKTFNAAGRTHFRSEVNILLCGDPGTSKSQLLRWVYNLVPRAQYTSGRGSSAVGLTAYVTKDPDTKQLTLQTGALVLADNGICCIDEFDKMSEATRSVLHEVMEQQTLSIAKAGIICQLNARTSILAAANPAESQWNKNKTIVENVQLPHTLMSRFDLIFLVLDPQDESFDRRLATHLVSIYYKDESNKKTLDDNGEDLFDAELMRDYIAFTKEHIKPKLTEEAQEKLVNAYVNMRRAGSGRGLIAAYPRQLESLIRLSEAHAKCRLSTKVEASDVDEASRLHSEALKQSATDPVSGRVDIGILTTGVGGAGRARRTALLAALKALLKNLPKSPASVARATLLRDVNQQSQATVSKEQLDEALRDLQDEGVILNVSSTHIRVCK